jgi:hypothetical protein
MKRLVFLFAVSALAVSCAGKSGEQTAGSEAAGKPLEGIVPGAVFLVSTDSAKKIVQKSIGQSHNVSIGDQLKYFGRSGSGRGESSRLYQFSFIGNHNEPRSTDSAIPYVANLTAGIAKLLGDSPVREENKCELYMPPCWYEREQAKPQTYANSRYYNTTQGAGVRCDANGNCKRQY